MEWRTALTDTLRRGQSVAEEGKHAADSGNAIEQEGYKRRVARQDGDKRSNPTTGHGKEKTACQHFAHLTYSTGLIMSAEIRLFQR